MRTFKFRAWDRSTKEYVNIESFDASDGQISTVIDTSGINGDIPGEWDLEQYTGLHDSEHAKIYEGDIVRIYSDDNENFDAEVKYMSDYDYPAFDVEAPNDWIFDGNILSEAITSFYIEVIGNIHENPELLEAKR